MTKKRVVAEKLSKTEASKSLVDKSTERVGEPSARITLKKQRFADEYLIDLNATAAYKRAGYKGVGHVAESSAAEILSNPEVQAYVKLRMKKREERTEVTQDRVLQEYAKLAFLDPRRFYDEHGGLIPIPLLPADVAAALVGMEVITLGGKDEDGKAMGAVSKIKFSDKKGALDSVARHLGMFIDRSEVQVTTHEASLDDLA